MTTRHFPFELLNIMEPSVNLCPVQHFSNNRHLLLPPYLLQFIMLTVKTNQAYWSTFQYSSKWSAQCDSFQLTTSGATLPLSTSHSNRQTDYAVSNNRSSTFWPALHYLSVLDSLRLIPINNSPPYTIFICQGNYGLQNNQALNFLSEL